MKSKQVKVFAPATISNVGAGFDVLGIALEMPGDVIVAERQEEAGLRFSLQNSSVDVPTGANNVAYHVAKLMLDELNPPFGVSMRLQKNMPLGSGLGSSGASCAAAAFAINSLLLKPLSKMDLIRFAVEGERLASGAAHADNVAPSILGGVCLIRSYSPLDIIQLPNKSRLFWVVARPHLVIHTKDARSILPLNIPLTTAVEQWGNLGALITGLIQGDNTLIGKSLRDSVAEPVRAPLIPGYYDVKRVALASGAIAFSISGSGPSVFAATPSLSIAKQVAVQIKHAFLQFAQIDCDIYISRINPDGAKLLEKSL